MHTRPEKLKTLEPLPQKYEVIQASKTDINWIAKLESEIYSGIDIIPLPILKEWYNANSNGFYIVKKNNENVGHIDILPIREKILNQFINGEITEQEIRGDSIFKAAEKKYIKHLYVESIAIPFLRGISRTYALKLLIKEFPNLINNLCIPQPSTIIYAMPASIEGANIIEKLKFELEIDGSERKDRHSIYKISYSSLINNMKKYTKNQD